MIYISSERILVVQVSACICHRPGAGLSCFADQDIKTPLEPLHSGTSSDKLFQVHVDQPETAEPTELVQLKCNCPQILSVFAELIVRIVPLIQIHTAVKAVFMIGRTHSPHAVNHMRGVTGRHDIHIYIFHKRGGPHNIPVIGGGVGGGMGNHGRTSPGLYGAVFAEYFQLADIYPFGSNGHRVGRSITGSHTDVLGSGRF